MSTICGQPQYFQTLFETRCAIGRRYQREYGGLQTVVFRHSMLLPWCDWSLVCGHSLIPAVPSWVFSTCGGSLDLVECLWQLCRASDRQRHADSKPQYEFWGDYVAWLTYTVRGLGASARMVDRALAADGVGLAAAIEGGSRYA